MNYYDLKNTINEVRSDQTIKPYLDVMYSEDLYSFMPAEMLDKPLSFVADHVIFPWGKPFDPEDFLRAVQTAQGIVYDHTYQLIPLWREEKKDFIPDISKNDKDHVFFMTKNKSYQEIRPAVIICPGGSYETLSFDQEGVKMSEIMEQAGYAAFILNYRVSPNRYPAPQYDLLFTIKYLRVHAEEYHIDPDKILLIGSSAGGHLCASAACLYQELDEGLNREIRDSNLADRETYIGTSARPDALCLNYPVISFVKEQHEQSFQALTGGDETLREKLSVELHVNKNYPKTFVWACEDDSLVPASNARRLGRSLKQNGVESILKIYPQGEHGCGLGTGTSAEGWIDEMIKFINFTPVMNKKYS